MAFVRAHLLISGRVQGVFFRHATRGQAEQLGIAGWIRNLPDGRVEAVFEGDKSDVERMIAWSRQGPPSARVEHIDIRWEDLRDEPGFRVR